MTGETLLSKPEAVLVPSDFSLPAAHAFEYALRFGRRFGAQLIFIHVLEPALVSGVPCGLATSRSWKESISASKKHLRNAVNAAHSSGVRAKSDLRSGLAADEIVAAAKDHDVDLVIIATHGHTSWKHFCIGSTAEKVVQTAPCPVWIVRENEHELG